MTPFLLLALVTFRTAWLLWTVVAAASGVEPDIGIGHEQRRRLDAHQICDNSNGAFLGYSLTTCHNDTYISETSGRCETNGTSSSETVILTSCATRSGNFILQHCSECGAQVVCTAAPQNTTSTICSSNDNELQCNAQQNEPYWAMEFVCLVNPQLAAQHETCNSNGVRDRFNFAITWCPTERPICHNCRDIIFCADQAYTCSQVGLGPATLSPTAAPSLVPTASPTRATSRATTATCFLAWILGPLSFSIICGMHFI